MSINSRYRTDRDKETEGTLIEFKDDLGKVVAWFKCRRPGGRNTEFQKVFNRLLRERRQEIAAEKGDEAYNALLAECFADTIIIDWGGEIEGPNGEVPAECTKENVIWLFTVDAPDLFADLTRRLEFRSRWQSEERDLAGKNSKAVSTTNSGGDSKSQSSLKDGKKD